jgi:hypothetical protein
MIHRIAHIWGPLALITLGCGNSGNGDTPDAAVQVDAPHPSPDAPMHTAGLTAIPLVGLGGGYTAKLSFGAQAFDVIVDTGSSSTGVAAATCTNCSVSPEYTGGTDLHATASSQYGSGSWKGEVFEDTATMGNRAPVTLDFASITSQTSFFQGPGFQGILGLGPDALLLPHTTSYLTTSIAAGMTAQLGFQLCPDDGTMWLGGYDAAAATAAPSFAPIVSGAPYYMINVAGASVSGSASLTSTDFGPTIIDTGTTQTFVPTTVLSAVTTAVTASAGYTAAFGSQALSGGACLNTAMSSAELDAALPPLSLSFGSGTPISLPATRSYLFAQGGGQYCFMFADSSQLFGGQKVSLFGNTLLAGMITIFDIANKQIGFAPQTGCAEPSVAPKARINRRPSIDPAVVHAALEVAR